MGGFITASARQSRANFRPLVQKAPWIIQRIYDLLGIVLSAMILNYSASPFILLSGRDSILSWKRLGWHGHIIIMGSLVVFAAGGTKFCRNWQKKLGVLPPSKKPAANGTAPSNGVSTDEKVAAK